MKNLIIEPTEYTPKVLLNPKGNKFLISGEEFSKITVIPF